MMKRDLDKIKEDCKGNKDIIVELKFTLVIVKRKFKVLQYEQDR